MLPFAEEVANKAMENYAQSASPLARFDERNNKSLQAKSNERTRLLPRNGLSIHHITSHRGLTLRSDSTAAAAAALWFRFHRTLISPD